MNQFKHPPLLPHIGSSFAIFFKVISKGHIEFQYYYKIVLTVLVILIARPFQLLDFHCYRKKLKKFTFSKEPLFIIGHWRSGTTLVHNYLCQDRDSGYLTTYHSLFPNNLKSTFLFETFTHLGMPSKRPSDNMDMNEKYPQEGELAIGNLHTNFYYNFFYFPAKYKEFYNDAVHMQVAIQDTTNWKKAYMNLIKKAALNTKGQRVIMKNPVNTARIKIILEMFPEAKFLFLYRNPITVYFSTQRFFYKLLPTVWLQSVDNAFIDKMILDVYVCLMDDYNVQKQLIPSGNLMELKFEDFEENPIGSLKTIYTDLLNEDFNKIKDTFVQYMNSLKNYKKNSYFISKNAIDIVSKYFEKYMKIWNYNIPEDIMVV